MNTASIGAFLALKGLDGIGSVLEMKPCEPAGGVFAGLGRQRSPYGAHDIVVLRRGNRLPEQVFKCGGNAFVPLAFLQGFSDQRDLHVADFDPLGWKTRHKVPI